MSHLTTARYVDPTGRRRNLLKVRAVACPTCHAQPGESCVTVGGVLHPNIEPGRPAGSNHPARRLMAIRAANGVT